MRIILIFLALLCLPAQAQQNQQRVATITTVVTTQTVSGFQLALQSASRNSCTIQYNGVGTGFVYFGLLANATTQNAFRLTGGQTIQCVASGVTLTDPVAISSTSTGEQFVVTTQ